MMDRMKKMLSLVDEWADYTIDIRRKIHENPELGFQEFKTSALIAGELERLGIPYEKSPVEPGLIATIDSGKPGKLMMLRADMDALPIDEKTDLPFRSKTEGVMHACGHDVHAANLLTVGAILNLMKSDWTGRIKLVFQPAEEGGGAGGREMIKHGLLDEAPDCCMALHVGTDPKGLIIFSPGYRTSYSDACHIKVHGKASHSSKPHEGVDAILIAANIIMTLNTISSRNIDPQEPSTLNVGTIKGGRTGNILADEVEMLCMMRNARPGPRKTMIRRVQETCTSIAAAMGGSCDVTLEEGYPAVYNDEALTEFIRTMVEAHKDELYEGIGEGVPEFYMEPNSEQKMGAEDFGFYSEKVPCFYVKIGTGEYAPQHNQKFQVDEDYIKLCTRFVLMSALEYMN